MSRYFAPISIEDLKAKITSAFKKSDTFPFVTEKVGKDLSKVDFDTENCSNPTWNTEYKFGSNSDLIGFHQLDNELAVYIGAAGGDWQIPINFVIYWSGKELRGYIPEVGNPYNTKTKRAYGDDDSSDIKNIKDRFNIELTEEKGLEDFELDPELAGKLILEDIQERILPQPAAKVAKKLSFQEQFEALKFYAPGDEGSELFAATCSLAYQANGIDSPERVEYLYKWAKEQCDQSYKWVKENEPEGLDDFITGHWGY